MSCIPEYLEQVRTKRRSLDRTELASSPTKEIGDEPKGKTVVLELSISKFEILRVACLYDLFLTDHQFVLIKVKLPQGCITEIKYLMHGLTSWYVNSYSSLIPILHSLLVLLNVFRVCTCVHMLAL